MPISGTTKGKSYARLNLMRLGATRLDYYQPWVTCTIAGTNRSSGTRIGGATITQNLDGIPDTAQVRVSGFAPTRGQDIKLQMGDTDVAHRIFAGHILNVSKVYEGDKVTNAAYDLACIDYTWRFKDKKILKKYASVSATTIILDLMATYASWATTVHVAVGLPTIDEMIFTNEELPDALDRIMRAVGGYWYLDYGQDLHAFLSEDFAAQSVTDAHDSGWEINAVNEDVSQTRTRFIQRGGGGNASVAVTAGATSLPVTTAAWYDDGGGIVEIGPQRVTYTGLKDSGAGTVTHGLAQFPSQPVCSVASGQSGDVTGVVSYEIVHRLPTGDSEVSEASATATVAAISAPGSAPTATVGTGGSAVTGNLIAGSYKYKTTFVTSKGETLAGAASGFGTIAVVSSSSSLLPSGTTGGSLTASGAYSYQVSFVTSAGETAPLTANSNTLTAGQNAFSLTSISTSPDARVTARKIYRTKAGGSVFYLVITINDNTTTGATDTTADASLGTVSPPTTNTTGFGQVSLTSIPTSGDARVTARKIYRLNSGGSNYCYLATIADNVTTTLTDNTVVTGLGALEPTADSSGGGVVTVTVPIGGADVTARRLYRTEAGGSVYRLVGTISDNVTTTYTDSKGDAALGDVAPDASTVRTEAGSTSLPCDDMTVFCTITGGFGPPTVTGAGWILVGSQLVSYNGGFMELIPGTLTFSPTSGFLNIPGAGLGALLSAVPVGTGLVMAPHLTGIPASGTGAILYDMPVGTPVDLRVEINDATAQSNLASWLGTGDGIVEDYPEGDGRIGSTEATSRAEARQALYNSFLSTVSGTTRDQTVRPGRSITFTLTNPSVSGTYKLQQVTISQIAFGGGSTHYVWPLRTAQASSVRFSFEDLIRQFQGKAN